MATLDLSKYKTAAGAAKAFSRFLKERIEADIKLSEEMGVKYRGPNPDYVLLRGPDDPDETWARGVWHVVWEEGPSHWATCLSNGMSMAAEELASSAEAFQAEFGRAPKLDQPEVTGLYNPDHLSGKGRRWHAEPGFSFSLIFTGD